MDLEARLQHLPIFPLPSVQLFPHALLPLHVFEPRYRELLRDCLARDRLFAVVSLDPRQDPGDDAPSVCGVCGVGEVIAHEPLPDGRSNILLHGVGRAQIVVELDSGGPYRVVRARAMSDRYPTGIDLAAPLRSLVALTDRMAARLPSGGDTLRALARSHDDPGALTDVLAAALVTDPTERQRLLEDTDVITRLDALSTVIATTLSRLRSHPPSSSN